MLNDDEIVTSVQVESEPFDDEKDKDEDNNNESSKGASNAGTFSELETAVECGLDYCWRTSMECWRESAWCRRGYSVFEGEGFLILESSVKEERRSLVVFGGGKCGTVVGPKEMEFFRTMSQRSHLTDSEAWRVVGRLEGGQTQAEVAQAIGVSQSVISRIWNRFLETGSAGR
ncbi:hypothetical protein TNCV_1664641 [Trichonephila clavipes]|uniref:HTH cro/C1-type domain-containing protein n=1 Tax=Trichonephila clavipes TaxID=2585209 RepID=A0A8X6VBU8_TRICX|nr:hypothetical protein TNCV_1664641 [Trichonephila clavipes]